MLLSVACSLESAEDLVRIESVYDYKQLESGPNAEAQPETPGLVDQALSGDLADIESVVVAVRHRGGGHYYESFGYAFFDPRDTSYSRTGGRLVRIDIHTGEWTVLLEDPAGGLRDPCVSFDGQRMLFSWLKSDEEFWQVYEMDLTDGSIRRITDAPFDDVEPIYLPDGDIVFVSSRAGRGVPCWRTQVGLLHRCEADGSGIRMLSNGIEHEIRPWLLHDGRIVYNRWEYINRGFGDFHHLWTMNPDGTGSMTFYGNFHPGFAITEARPIPGSDRVLCIFGPAHGRGERQGYVSLLSVDAGPDDKSAALAISQTSPSDHRLAPGVWRDPHPFSEETYLVCWEDGLYVMNRAGEFECLWRVPHEAMSEGNELSRSPLWVHEPMPLQPHPAPPIIPERVDYSQEDATLILQDVRMGRSLGVSEGERIEKLLVMEVLPMPLSYNWTKDTASIQSSSYNLKRILGTVPVEEDGSAMLKVPAMRDIFFIALDDEDQVVEEMNSFVCLMPGEVTSCVGCHEHRTHAPPPMSAMALQAVKRAPSEVAPYPGAPPGGIFDYPRDIQPLLNRHCAECHSWKNPQGDMVLDDSIGVRFHHSIQFLARRNLHLAQRGTSLLDYFTGGHHEVAASSEDLAILRAWLLTHAQYSGTYGSFGMGTDGTGMPWADQDQPDLDYAPNAPHLRFDTTVLANRCDACHLAKDERSYQGRFAGRTWPFTMSRSDLYNIEQPELSLILRAPLATDAGGLGLCRARPALSSENKNRRSDTLVTEGEPLAVFEGTDDPDYQSLLRAVESLSAQMHEKRVFPVPGWRPLPDTLREMKRYGALPPDFDIFKDEVDPFALDEAYFELFYPGGSRFHE